MTLREVERIALPAKVLEQTEDSLRAAGNEGFEVFVLWSGINRGEVFEVRTAHVPKQTGFRSERGLLVRVEGEALHKLNRWLYENRETLAIQIHAHPSDAYHSETDDTYPIVTALGGFSIVAADFCRGGLLAAETMVYRLREAGWDLVEPAHELIEVI